MVVTKKHNLLQENSERQCSELRNKTSRQEKYFVRETETPKKNQNNNNNNNNGTEENQMR